MSIQRNSSSAPMARHHILAQGQVQGVGFRPFIYRLAHKYTLTGHVNNTAQGVHIEVQGPLDILHAFSHELQNDLPPLAKLTHFAVNTMDVQPQEEVFSIIHSESSPDGTHSVLISPDMGLCPQCQEDMQNLHSARFMYAFTNCTNCGPRYTITHSIPYDRPHTSMACFPLCPSCQAEYDNPMDRRFHAQPNACPQCGPKVWLVEAKQCADAHATQIAHCPQDQEALQNLAHRLLQGQLAAMKGLGGFHLTCHACDVSAIERLRLQKNRPHKPLAVMVADMTTAHMVAHISPQEEALLASQEKPIVLCQRKALLPDILAPDTDTIGLVLPYTPLHTALFQHLQSATTPQQHPPALVMTSGNAAGEPLCLGNREALQRLAPMADVFLLHNRDILIRNDDSVCAVHNLTDDASQTVFLRRARGYVPRPTPLPHWAKEAPTIMGMGAELKNTLCLTRQDAAFVSQHMGDMQNLSTGNFYRQVHEHMEMLLQVKATCVVHDAHPDFFTTHVAQELASQRSIPCHALQHHFAHAYAVLAEHGHEGPALALSLDGTGYGLDGTIWGGELLHIQGSTHARLGRLSPFALVGGERAIREPWRMAVTLAQGTKHEAHFCQAEPMAAAVLEMLAKNIHCPQTSSVGRLFDAVSAGLGLCQRTTYEGQAAIRLEHVQKALWQKNTSPLSETQLMSYAPQRQNQLWEVDGKALFTQVMDYAEMHGTAAAAQLFHGLVAQGFSHMAQLAAKEHDIYTIVLCGGVMQNATLHRLLYSQLTRMGFTVLTAQDIPANDGGIALGQAYYGLLRWHETC